MFIEYEPDTIYVIISNIDQIRYLFHLRTLFESKVL